MWTSVSKIVEQIDLVEEESVDLKLVVDLVVEDAPKEIEEKPFDRKKCEDFENDRQGKKKKILICIENVKCT